MKTILITLFAFIAFFSGKKNEQRWVIEKSSSISILGKSNVNRFRCEIKGYYKPDTLVISGEENQVAVKGGLLINVNDFDCHQKMITRDLRKTLKAKDNPFMKIQLLTLSRFAGVAGDDKIKGWVAIELAGITRTIAVDYVVKRSPGGALQFHGSQQVNLSDFDLNCPGRLAGLIKVDDQIDVTFILQLRCL